MKLLPVSSLQAMYSLSVVYSMKAQAFDLLKQPADKNLSTLIVPLITNSVYMPPFFIMELLLLLQTIMNEIIRRTPVAP